MIVYRLNDRLRREERGRTGRLADPTSPLASIQYFEGPLVAHITRRDLGKFFVVSPEDREYRSGRLPKFPRWWRFALARIRRSLRLRPAAPPLPPTVLVETTTVDTGERREMFGHEARHTITTRRETSLDASGAEPKESVVEHVVDGWYVDLDTTVTCDTARRFRGKTVHTHSYVTVQSVARGKKMAMPDPPRVAFKDVGTPERGFPLVTSMTHRSTHVLPDGTPKTFESTHESEVIELREEPFDAALFEVPRGSRRVRQVRQDPRRPLSD